MSLELIDINLSIEGRTLLHDFSLTVANGETVSIMGPSGCGKSSLLGYLCGSLAPGFKASGEIYVRAENVTHLPMEKRHIGLLFQDDLLFPHMSVGENLAFALPRGLSRKIRQERISQALESAGLPDFHNADPASLSGGQRSRISLMRTLLAEPRALLLDEPFSRLDADLRQRFRSFVFETIREQNIPALLVTHDMQDCNGRIITLADTHAKTGVAHA
ncbi:ATP-binding cassette domain-containing protein [Sansalvadorimonas sp. 2012CJ34-2]|uniref:ATP-binding cassette domain-containing protein n=1 Tax=Parendozoicomonas callyspongiae TaxID=2942213 RepID=A0ABT0PJ61_9GAMM|nr:ATP-binding cassette domain-containing protein [Sansalvadorimonas sp. 2012CJ34-2]MCL6271429.1 ATP-binding cassette domain-containing protein [Sansalvadorimonas sp. 2012CJ34-2]